MVVALQQFNPALRALFSQTFPDATHVTDAIAHHLNCYANDQHFDHLGLFAQVASCNHCNTLTYLPDACEGYGHDVQTEICLFCNLVVCEDCMDDDMTLNIRLCVDCRNRTEETLMPAMVDDAEARLAAGLPARGAEDGAAEAQEILEAIVGVKRRRRAAEVEAEEGRRARVDEALRATVGRWLPADLVGVCADSFAKRRRTN